MNYFGCRTKLGSALAVDFVRREADFFTEPPKNVYSTSSTQAYHTIPEAT